MAVKISPENPIFHTAVSAALVFTSLTGINVEAPQRVRVGSPEAVIPSKKELEVGADGVIVRYKNPLKGLRVTVPHWAKHIRKGI